jgi:hypothetical protein
MNAKANTGSMPDEQPAIILIVPVGAIVTTVAFLIDGYFLCQELTSKFVNDPRVFPSSLDFF